MIPLSYNLRSLSARRSSTIAAGVGIALVVFIFAAVLMLSAGVTETLRSAGSEQNGLIIRKGSQAEMQSVIEEEKVALLKGAPEIATNADGMPLVSPEMIIVVSMPRIGAEGVSMVTVRGVTEAGPRLRDKVRIVQGRPARPGTDEVVVGRALIGRVKGVALDQGFELKRNRAVRVVGVMEADGSSIESEIWGDLAALRSIFAREGVVSSILLRFKDAQGLESMKTRMNADPRLGLEIKRETTHYEEQSSQLSIFINALGLVVAVFFSFGAMIGAMIVVYAQISARTREIGTLRALGFRRGRVLLSFLIESILLSAIGGVVGCVASLGMGLVSFTTINFQTFSEVVFRFRPTPEILLSSLLFATVMGLVGGFFPALRAARISPVQAMRG